VGQLLGPSPDSGQMAALPPATQDLATAHDDYVHDVAYDYYGRRIATCSSDQKIKIWMQGPDGSWLRQAEWKAHYGPVWRVTFAHPEFGQVIASCSFDHNVLVWEEQEGVDDKGRVVSRWHKRAQLSDARDSVNEIKFAPRHMGLKIAAGSADGHVRVYEATDATSLAHWEFSDEFEAEPSSTGGVACLAWTTSPFDTAMMVVGGGSGMAKVRAAAHSSIGWRLLSPLGASCPAVVARGDNHRSSAATLPLLLLSHAPCTWPLFYGVALYLIVRRPSLALLACPQVWGYAPAARRWLPMLELRGHGGRVQDVAWAPNVGRSYHLIVTGDANGAVTIWKLQPDSTADYAPDAAAAAASTTSPQLHASASSHPADGAADGGAAAAPGGRQWSVRKLPGASAEASVAAVFEDHRGMPVWRVEWNVTGTVMASSGDDGVLRLRKQTQVGAATWGTTAELDMAAPSGVAPVARSTAPSAAVPAGGGAAFGEGGMGAVYGSPYAAAGSAGPAGASASDGAGGFTPGLSGPGRPAAAAAIASAFPAYGGSESAGAYGAWGR